MSEIEKVANHFGRSLTIDGVCSEKTDVCQCRKISAEIALKSTGFREIVGAGLLTHLLPQKLLCWQACFVSTISRWMRTNLTLTMWAK